MIRTDFHKDKEGKDYKHTRLDSHFFLDLMQYLFQDDFNFLNLKKKT